MPFVHYPSVYSTSVGAVTLGDMQKERRAKFDKEQIELRSLLLYFIFILLCMLRERCAGGALVKLTDADWPNWSSPGTTALPNPDVTPVD